jgi:hypothetical protein
MYNIVHPGYSIDKANQPDPDPLAAVQYACVYWDYVCGCSSSRKAMTNLEDSGSIGLFFFNVYFIGSSLLPYSEAYQRGSFTSVFIRALLPTIQLRKYLDIMLDHNREISANQQSPICIPVCGIPQKLGLGIIHFKFTLQG